MIKEKRDSLETFIHEQLIGPGGCGNRYGVFPPDEESEEPICEVINTTPGSIYSSAILFPRRNDSPCDESQPVDPTCEDNIGDENASDEDSNEQGEELIGLGDHEEDEDINSLGRRFPDRIGVSCCVKELNSLGASTSITISGRYYRKLLEHTRLYVQIDDVEFFENVFSNENA